MKENTDDAVEIYAIGGFFTSSMEMKFFKSSEALHFQAFYENSAVLDIFPGVTFDQALKKTTFLAPYANETLSTCNRMKNYLPLS